MSNKQHPQIGKHSEYEPLQCAVTGQWVQGRHATTYNLKDNFYFRILAKAKPPKATIDVIREELNAEVDAIPTKKVPMKKEVKPNDQ